MSEDLNIIKRTCKDLGLTYAQLAEQIGYGENSVSNASRGEVSKAMQKAIELYLQTLEQKKELEKLETLRSTLKSILN
jgi:transcriptional regulator with XRE-family HTH domain